MKQEQQLKLCPFCGGSAYIRETDDMRFHVVCKKCGCRTSDYRSWNTLIEVWNFRFLGNIINES